MSFTANTLIRRKPRAWLVVVVPLLLVLQLERVPATVTGND
jgi:hypothetical protein